MGGIPRRRGTTRLYSDLTRPRQRDGGWTERASLKEAFILARTRFAVGLVLAAAVPAMAGAADIDGRLVHGGVERTYTLHLPDRQGPVPLVVLLHGGGGDGARIERIAGFRSLADEAGFAVAYPDALHKHWNDGREPDASEAHRRGVDDAGFLAALIERLAADPRLDRRRVYVAGASNGGMMALRLACEQAGRLAAAAAVIANQPWPQAGQCRPSRPIPVLIMNGTADPMMPWAGGPVGRGWTERGRVLSTDETVALWRRVDGCADESTFERLPDRDRRGEVSVDRIRWTACRDGAEVVLMRINGGGHRWPGGAGLPLAGLLGPGTDDVDATREIWEFFRGHALPL
jgi:polyhydroxybutyrate depolymerase